MHFFIDDYQFERFWTQPTRYLDRLSKYNLVMTPDFSLYTDMPIAMQVWNVYRSRLLGQIMQSYGIVVVPTLQWSDERSFGFVFDGLPEGGTFAVSTLGCRRNADASEKWRVGMKESIDRLNPSQILLYGDDMGFDFGKIKVVRYAVTSIAGKEKNGR